MKETNYNYTDVFPSFTHRLQALFFDFWIVIAAVMGLSTLLLSGYDQALIGIKILMFFILLFIYEPIGNMTGGTIGYRTMGMSLRQFGEPSKKVNLSQAYLRAVTKVFLGWMSFLSIAGDPFKRAIHDKVSGTVVVIQK
jgi:uncharacterized RDD family membrane protein YckC